MILIDKLARYIIDLSGRVGTALKTAAARRVAFIGQGTRVLSTGRIVNINGEQLKLQIGNDCVIAGELLVFRHAGRIQIGDWVFVGEGTRIWSSCDLVIGNRVLISHNVEIHDTDSHPLNPVERFKQTEAIFKRGHPEVIEGIRASPIEIGDDVWIGFGATIRRGVKIGDRAIIGARAIVDFDVPDDGLVKANQKT